MSNKNTDPSGQTLEKKKISDRFLDSVERVGNKLPEPFLLFLGLFVITGILATIMNLAGATYEAPGSDEGPQDVKGLFTGEGLTWFTSSMGDNFIGFPPLAIVLPVLLGVGIAEKTGLLQAAMTAMLRSAPKWILPYAVGLVGIFASVMTDAAFVIIPPLAAYVFKAAGRHPVAGLLGGFGAVGAGYSTALVPTTLDANFAGITTAAMQAIPGVDYSAVTPVSNYFFNIVASLILAVVAGFIIDKVLEPRLVRQNVLDHHIDGSDIKNSTLSSEEKRALKHALIAAIAAIVALIAIATVPGSPWLNEDNGLLPESPFMDSIVFLVFGFFVITGLTYGISVGTIKATKDVVRMMGEAINDMMSFVVLAFVLGQFVAFFNWSGIGTWVAVSGAELLEAMDLPKLIVVLLFIILAGLINMFLISGSGQWTIMAAVFVPMLALIGLEPAFIQAAFRIGDSSTMVLTPLNPYMIVMLGLLRKYEPNAGLGSIISRVLPFAAVFTVVWTGLLCIWYAFDLPLGPGNGIFI